jgi:hypothetical protein
VEVLPDAVVSAQLGPDEELLWSGKPRGGIRLRAQDTFSIPFSLMWCGFAVFWETMAMMIPGPFFGPGLLFRLWGIPFVIAGLYFVFGRFFVDALARSSRYSPPAFEMIDNVKNVYQLIRSTQKQLLSA